MPIYAYTGLTSQGRTVRGVIDADSAKGARLSLRRTDIFPTAVEEEATEHVAQAVPSAHAGMAHSPQSAHSASPADSASPRTAARPFASVESLFERVSAQDLALFTRQFATLAGAGLPLVECLSTLIEQIEHNRLKRVLTHVRQQVREGHPLAEALQAHPRVFSDIYINMIRAGEASGALETVLSRLAEYNENQARLLRTVQTALTYPVVMIVVAMVIVAFLLAYVVPEVTRVFQNTGQTLPLATRILLGLSSFLINAWWLILLGGACGTFAWLRVLQTPKGRGWYDRTLLQLPRIGRLVQRLNVARFARTLSTLLASGVPILKALSMVAQLMKNSVLRQTVEEARASVQEGESLAAPLRRSGVFPALLVQMIAVGERSGELELMLSRAAQTCDEEVSIALSRFTSLLEPLTILVMGGVVLFIVLAILLPIFELNQLV